MNISGIALERMGLLFTAEQWLKRIILDRQEKTEECPLLQAAFKLFQDVRNRRIYGPLTKVELFILRFQLSLFS